MVPKIGGLNWVAIARDTATGLVTLTINYWRWWLWKTPEITWKLVFIGCQELGPSENRFMRSLVTCTAITSLASLEDCEQHVDILWSDQWDCSFQTLLVWRSSNLRWWAASEWEGTNLHLQIPSYSMSPDLAALGFPKSRCLLEDLFEEKGRTGCQLCPEISWLEIINQRG